MKKIVLVFSFLLCALLSFGQNKEAAKILIEEGIPYYDKGDFKGAISKYDEALKADKDNLFALSEKSMSLIRLQKFEEAIVVCKKALEVHPNDKSLENIYVQYGNALDGLKETDSALAIYSAGIKKFPDYYQLYYNKGITLTSINKYNEAIETIQNALLLKPNHASSHNAIARISMINNQRIQSFLAYWRFFTLEPEGKRAEENLGNILSMLKDNIEQKDDKTINITMNRQSLDETKRKANDFSAIELILTMDAAFDFDVKNKNKSDIELFVRKFDGVCSSLATSKNKNFGFFWEYYAPYFIEMKAKNLTETFGYIVFASSDNTDVSTWLKANKTETDKFFEWSNAYKWESK